MSGAVREIPMPYREIPLQQSSDLQAIRRFCCKLARLQEGFTTFTISFGLIDRALPQSNVPHMRCSALGDIRKRVLGQLLIDRGKHVFPEAGDEDSGGAFASGIELQQLAFEGVDNVQQSHGGRVACQLVSSILASPAFDQAGVAQLVQDLHQVVCGYFLDCRKIVDAADIARAKCRLKLNQHSACVLDFQRKFHLEGREVWTG